MTYTVLIVAFVSICAAIGLAPPRRASNKFLPAWLAAGMIGAQFLLFWTR